MKTTHPMSAVIFALLVTLSAGCSCGARTAAQLLNDEADALCTWEARCGAIGRSESAKCSAQAGQTLHDSTSYDVDAAVAAHRLQIDDAAASRCFDSLRNASCSYAEGFSGAACSKVYLGLVAIGGACQSSLECAHGFCAFGTATAGCAGVCTDYVAEGALCSLAANKRCDPAKTFCNNPTSVDAVCAALGAAGASCAPASPCQTGLNCANSICALPPTAGQSCSFFLGCASGLFCQGATVTTSGVCAAPVRPGDACSNAAACPSEQICAGLLASGQGTCSSFLDVGSACEVAKAERCPADMQCDPATLTCVRHPDPVEGAACTVSGSECAAQGSAIFAPQLYCDSATLVCAKKHVPGAACTPAVGGGVDPCVSHCNATSHTCDPLADACF